MQILDSFHLKVLKNKLGNRSQVASDLAPGTCCCQARLLSPLDLLHKMRCCKAFTLCSQSHYEDQYVKIFSQSKTIMRFLLLTSSSLLGPMIMEVYSTALKRKTVLRQIFHSFPFDKYKICLPICNLLVSSVFLFLFFYLF